MSEWQPIGTTPASPMRLLFYMATAQWHLTTGEVADIPEIEAVRFEIGYWDGTAYREQGTNHEVFEWDEPGDDPDKPTHWMPLPEPPVSPSQG